MKSADKIARILLAEYFAGNVPHDAERLLAELVASALRKEPRQDRENLQRLIQRIRDDSISRAPPELRAWLKRAITQPALRDWAVAALDPAAIGVSVDEFEQPIKDWFAGLPAARQAEFIGAALRRRIGQSSDLNGELRKSFVEALTPKEVILSTPAPAQQTTTFAPDTRGLPAILLDFDQVPPGPGWTAYYQAITDGLTNFGLPPNNNDPVTAATYAAITGMMLFDGQTDQTNAAFQPALQRIWLEAMGRTIPAVKVPPLQTPYPNRQLYADIAALLASTNSGTVLYQQFAYTARYAIQHSDDVPVGSPLFNSQVAVAAEQYVAGPPPAESLDLPPLLGGTIQDAELDPANMQIFSLVYAIAQGEEFGVFRTADTLAESWINGLLATQFDTGGKQLDAWYWSRKDRMTEAERRSMYTRMLGMPGGEIPRELQPNTEFNDRFWSFLAAVAEFDRQTRIADLFSGSIAGNSGQSLVMTMENVRQKGHDLGANMSLYSWGFPHYGARRANQDFTTAFAILQNPVIQNILGVTTPYQVIERTYISNFGKAPDIVRLRTMAVSGKAVLDIVARNSSAWTNSTGQPLFPNPYVNPGAFGAAPPPFVGAPPVIAGPPPAISVQDTLALIQNTNLILATNGVQYADIDKKSQPQLISYEPSMPALNGLQPTNRAANGQGQLMDKIKQMVSAGQTPSIDQLKSLLPSGFTN
jgi:hypothetical protein